jgi:NADH:ubiquinone oxidoreductase subunit H
MVDEQRRAPRAPGCGSGGVLSRGLALALSTFACLAAALYGPWAFSGEVGPCEQNCDESYGPWLTALVVVTVCAFGASFLAAVLAVARHDQLVRWAWRLLALGLVAAVVWGRLADAATGIS